MKEISTDEYLYLLSVKEALWKRISKEGEINCSSEMLMTDFYYMDGMGNKQKPSEVIIYKALMELEAEGFIEGDVSSLSRNDSKWKDVVFKPIQNPDSGTIAYDTKQEKNLRMWIEDLQEKASYAVLGVESKGISLRFMGNYLNKLINEKQQDFNRTFLQPFVEASFTRDYTAKQKAYNDLIKVVSDAVYESYEGGILTSHLAPGREKIAADAVACDYVHEIERTIDRYWSKLPAQCWNVMRKSVSNQSEPFFVEKLRERTLSSSRDNRKIIL